MRYIGKFIERAMWFYPAIQMGLIAHALISFVSDPSWPQGLWVFFLAYLLGPLLYQILRRPFPVVPGRHRVGPTEAPSGWMIAHRLQLIYVIFPSLEGMLLSLPGLYTNWLRLWGSRIGRRVYWGPDVRVLDRTHLTVGDGTFVGGAVLSCHLAIPRPQGLPELVFHPIVIGSRAFISAQSNLGPGSQVKDGEHVKILTQMYGSKRRELV